MTSPKGPKSPTAPGPAVVEALANPLAAGFTAAAIEQARDALKRELDARTFPDGGPMVLMPIEKAALGSLTSLGAQLILATTPTGGES